MIIGVDIDDVVADYINTLNAYVKKNHNIIFSRDMYKTYSFNETWNMPQEQFEKIFTPWRNSSEFERMPVVANAQNILNELAKENKIIFITSRNSDKERVTTQWLKNNFNFPIHVVHTFNKFVKNPAHKGKLETCKELGVQLMIEDQQEFSLECANGGIPVILLDNPWNKNIPQHKFITRVDDWLQAEIEIKKLAVK